MVLPWKTISFPWDSLVSWLFGVTTWFLFGESFLLLGKTSTASCFFKITTNQLLRGKNISSSWVWRRRQMGLPSHSSESLLGLFVFLLLGSFSCLLTLLGDNTALWRCQGNCSQPSLFLLQAFLLSPQLPSHLNSHFLYLTHCLLHDRIFSWDLSSLIEGLLLLTLFLKFLPKCTGGSLREASVCGAKLHLFARNQEMQSLFLAAAQPTKVEWKMSPYFVFRALETSSLCWVQGITTTKLGGVLAQSSSR